MAYADVLLCSTTCFLGCVFIAEEAGSDEIVL